MTPQEKEQLVSELEKALLKTKNEITLLEASIQPLAQDCSLEPLTKSELMGEINMNVTLLNQARTRQKSLEEALKRADSEEFGLCESCGEPIPFERLTLMPDSTECVACLEGNP